MTTPNLIQLSRQEKKAARRVAISIFTVIACVALFAVVLLASQSRAGKEDDAKAIRIRAKLNAIPTTEKVSLTNDEWSKILSRGQFYVLREAGTELPFFNQYANSIRKESMSVPLAAMNCLAPKPSSTLGQGGPAFTPRSQRKK